MSASTSEPTKTTLELTVGPVAHGGHFVAREQGRVIFVRHGIPGERVRVNLTENDADAKFWRADVTEVIEASPERVSHFWPQADALKAAARGVLPVGGAEFGHISRAAQIELKTTVVKEQLERLGGLLAEEVDALLPAGVENVDEVGDADQQAGLGWRTRVSFAVTANGKLGMHAHRSHDIIPIKSMPLAHPSINDLHLWELDLTGFERVDIAAPASGSGLLLLLAPVYGASEKATGNALKRVVRALAVLPDAPSVAQWNPENGAIKVVSGRGWVKETAGQHEFRVTGDGFWQIHRRAPELLSQTAVGMLAEQGYLPAGAKVADLYAGAGLFTAALADRVGPEGSVLSVEGYAGTSRDARKNLHAASQVEIVQGRVEKVLSGRTSAGESRRFDAVVLDPPRSGAGKGVVRALVHCGAKAVAYVSCDPAAFARDVRYFANHGWKLAQLRAFDLYPHTHHIETVALLVPKTPTV